MYFTVNKAFTNYFNKFHLSEELKVPILTNKTTTEYTLPIFLNNSGFDNSVFSGPQTLKEYISQYKHQKRNFDLKERHDTDKLDLDAPNKNFFTNNFTVDVFGVYNSQTLIITTMLILDVLCTHSN